VVVLSYLGQNGSDIGTVVSIKIRVLHVLIR